MIRQINQMLEQEGILPKGKRLDDVTVFRNEGITNLLFFFGEEKLDMGKLAAWRLKTRYQFGSTWMSDYVDNRLGGFLHEVVAEKPNCALIGEDGNIFNLMGIQKQTAADGKPPYAAVCRFRRQGSFSYSENHLESGGIS